MESERNNGMEKVDWKKAGEMLVNGSNFSEIARHFGVTRQYIHAHYVHGKPGRKPREKSVLYPMLMEWLARNNLSIHQFPNMLNDGKNIPGDYQRLLRVINGKTDYVLIKEINKIIQVTGLSYEELFMTFKEGEKA